jgi:transcriptional regulator with GAF, ATPase, and Fis domain
MAHGAQLDLVHVTDAIREALHGYGERAPANAASPPPSGPAAQASPPKARQKAPAREVLLAMMSRHQGNVAAVARDLAKDRAQIHRWLKQYDIEPDSGRGAWGRSRDVT